MVCSPSTHERALALMRQALMTLPPPPSLAEEYEVIKSLPPNSSW